MDDFLGVFFVLVLVFFTFILFFVPTFEIIESLEKLHNEYVCTECNSLVKK